MAENIAQILPKQFWKSPENVFFDFQNAQKLPLKTAKMSNFLSEYFDFQDHLLTFRGVNTYEIRPFKAKNKAQTLRKQLQKNTGANFAKSVDFLVYFRFKNRKISSLTPKNLKK